MEFISKNEIRILSNPGVESHQIISPENSASERLTITIVFVSPNAEQNRHKHDTSEQIWIALKGRGVLLLANDSEAEFNQGDTVRFADCDIHGLRNDSDEVFEYLSVTSPPIDFSYAYKEKK